MTPRQVNGCIEDVEDEPSTKRFRIAENFLQRLRQSAEFGGDILFKCNGFSVKAHRVVLQASTAFWEADDELTTSVDVMQLLADGYNITGVTKASMSTLLNYLYHMADGAELMQLTPTEVTIVIGLAEVFHAVMPVKELIIRDVLDALESGDFIGGCVRAPHLHPKCLPSLFPGRPPLPPPHCPGPLACLTICLTILTSSWSWPRHC